MKLSGPCFMPVHLGKPFNKWQVNKTYIKNHKIITESYYFNSQQDAETYYDFFIQEEARADLEKTIKSTRTYKWEKEELIEFKKTLDFSILENKIKNIFFIKEVNICEIRRQQ